MATYPLSFPAKAVAREKLQLNYRQAAMESPHTFAFQAVNTASQWVLEVTWPRMTHPQAQVIQGWINSLQGQVGTFRYSPRSSVNNALVGRTLTSAAYGYATTARMSGWGAAGASGLSVGQYFSLGSQLLQITAAPVNADANGQVLIEFAPMLRSNFAAGAQVNFASPSGIFRMTSAEGPAFTLDTDKKPEFPSLMAKEAI